MRTPVKWVSIFAALCLSTWLSVANSAAQEKQPPGDHPRVEPKGESDFEPGPPQEPRKPGGLKPRSKVVRDGDRPGNQGPGRPEAFDENQPPPGRPGDRPPGFMGKSPFEGRQPPGDGSGRGPGQGRGSAGVEAGARRLARRRRHRPAGAPPYFLFSLSGEGAKGRETRWRRQRKRPLRLCCVGLVSGRRENGSETKREKERGEDSR